MADTNLVESLQVDITAVDQTESATKSAGDHLDAVAEKGVALSDVMSGVGKASKTATDTLAEGADAAAGSFEKLGTQAVSRLKTLTKTLTDLSAQRDSLRADLQKATDEGLDTSEIETNLKQVENWIGRVGEKLQTVQGNLEAAATSQKAWNGQLGEENALLNGICEAENSRAQALGKTTKGYDQLTTAAKRAADAGQAALNGVTGSTVDVSGTVNMQGPDLSEALQQQDRIKESLNEIKDDAGLVAGELSDIGNTSGQSLSGLQAGLDRSASSFLRTGRAGSQLAKVMLQLMAAENRYEDAVAQAASVPDDKLDPAIKQSVLQDLKSQVDMRREQVTALKEAAEAEAELDAAQQKSTKSGKLEAYQITEIMDDAHKFLDMVLAGGNPLQALFYEAPNALAIAGGGGGYVAGLSMLKNALTGPAGIAVAAAAAGAAILGMGKYAESEQESLAQLSTHLRATRTDYTDMAEAAEKAARSLHQSDSDLSLSDSRTAVQTIVSVPTVNSSQIERYMTDARNLAAVMGETVPEAAKTMASALQDPAKAAEEFSQQGLPGFNAGLVLSVQHMQQMGDRAGALDTVLKRMEQTTKGAEEQALTPFQTALKNLKDETGGVGDAVSYSFQHMGDGIVSMATEGINALTDLIGLVEKIPEKVKNAASGIWDSVKTGAAWLGNGVESGVEGGLNFVGATNLAHIMGQGNTADPTFSMPSTTGSYGANKLSPSTASVDAQTAAVTKNTAAWEADRKEIDAHIGSDGSLSGQIADHQRNIEGLTSSIAKLKALGVEHYDSGNVESYNAAMKNLTGQLQAEEVALGNLRGPFAELLEQQDRATQSAAALTGYNQAMVEAAQQADDAARELSGGLASASEKAAVQAAAARTLAAEYTTSTSVMQRNTSLQGLIAEAWTQGGAAAEHATNYVQAYTDALDHYQEGSSAFAEAVAKRTKALDDQYSVTQKIQMAQQTDANNHQVQLLDAETATIGQNADARTKLINRMQVEQDQLQKGNSLEDESVQKLLASTDALSDATAEYQHAQQTLDDFTGSLSDMTDQLSDGVVQGFLQGTSSGMSFKSTMQGIEAQIVSMVAKMALINPLLNSIDGGTRTTLSDVNNMFSKTGSGSGSDSSQDDPLEAVSQSGWAMSPEEVQQAKKQINQSSGFNFSSLFGGGVGNGGTESLGGALNMGMGMLGGFAAGSSLSQLLSSKLFDGSKSSEMGGEVGSGVGSIVGGIFGGPLGSLVGGSVIGALGDAIGSLFAKRKKDYQYVSVGSDGMLDISGHVYKGIHGNDNVASGLQSDLDNINNVFGYTGVSATNTDTIGKVGWSKKGKKSKTYSLTDLLPDLDLTSSSANMQQELKQLMPSSFDSVGTFTQDLESLKSLADELDSMKVSVSKFDDSTHVTVDHFNGYTGDMAKALSTLDGKTLSTDDLQSQFQAIEEFVGTTMPGLLNVTASGSESLMQQVDTLKAKYQDAAKTAASYGLDAQALLDKGNAIAQQMIDAEQRTLDQADQSVQARDMAATGNQEGADLLNQQVSAAQEIQQLQDNWRSFLGDSYTSSVTYQHQMSDLEKTQADERLHIQQEYDQKSVEAAREAAEEREAAWASIQSMQESWEAADMAANGNQEGADLLNFDASGSQQKSQLDALAKTYWGGNYATQKQYQDMVLEMDKSLSDQRLQIQREYAQEAAEQQEEAAEQQQQYVDQAQQSIASIFSSLTTYVNGLATSDASPLSAEDQYGVANDNFQTDYKAAMGGDYDALSRIQTDAQTLLSTGKTYDGSGTDYASLFSTVTTDLGNLVNANLSKMQQTLITQAQSSTSGTKSLSDTVATLAKQVAELVASNQKVASTLKMNTLVTAQAGKTA